MADNKKILIDIQANTNNFVKELNEVNRLLSTVASTFSTMSNKLESGFADVASSSTSANRSLSAIESTIGKLVGEIQKLNSTSGSSSRAIDDLSSSTSRSTVSFNKAGNALDMFMKNMSPTQIQRSVDAVDHLNAAFNRLGGILPPIGRAFEWNLAYDLVQMPGRAIAAASQSVKQTMRETASLEGEIYDLEAFLGGPGGTELIEFAKTIGKTGTDEQLKTAGLQELQNKILSVGQESTFTALQIAKATTEAAKAGVSIEELAGPTGTALDAINLLAQNTGETLENSATNLSKLQNLFENNLSKTQVAFGQTADTGKQFQIIVDGLATADMSASATASELTQALFNVGGSAQNLNMSFFETVSLVASMVPAFESAASAGTSLKYMFSALSGGRSVKAQGALKELGLMDEYGQTVFFDKKGFKGLDFMVNQLREVFSDESGMAVDVRNRLITDIFGQDALKAVSRLVSMTDEQTREMLEMSAQLSANAAAGVQSAEEVAAIKNEGLEYDLEVLSGTMDSLGKTLAMPLLKPMSNVVQTFSAMGNAAFEVMTEAGTAEDIFKKYAESEVFSQTMIPGAANLLKMVVDYSQGLGVALTAVTEQGWNMKTLGTAVAALLGTPVAEIETRAKSLAQYFAHLYQSIAGFITELPATLKMVGEGLNYGFDKFMQAFDWLQTNWDAIIEGVKNFAIAWVVFQGLQVASTLVSIASGLTTLVASLGGISGIIAGITGAFTAVKLAVTGFFAWLAPYSSTFFFSAAWRTTLLLDLTVWGTRILAVLTSPWTAILVVVGTFVALFMNNVNGLRDFVNERFGFIGTYLVQTFEIISNRVTQVWTFLGQAVQSIGKTYFINGLSNIFKGVIQIIEGLAVAFGGVLKFIVGLVTFNGELIGSGLKDIALAVGVAIAGIARSVLGAVQSIVIGAIELLNTIPGIEIDTWRVDKMFEGLTDNEFFKLGASTAENMSQGYQYSMRNQTENLAKSSKDMIQDGVKDPIETSLEMHSPSRYMYRVGQNVMLGLADGIRDSAHVVTNEMLRVADTVASTDFSISGTGKTVQAGSMSPAMQSLGYEELYFLASGGGLPSPQTTTVPAFVNAPPPGTAAPQLAPYFGPQAVAYGGVDEYRKLSSGAMVKEFESNMGQVLKFSRGYAEFIKNFDDLGLEASVFGENNELRGQAFTSYGSEKIIENIARIYGVSIGEALSMVTRSGQDYATSGYTIADYMQSSDYASAQYIMNAVKSKGIPASNLTEYYDMQPDVRTLIKQNDQSIMYQQTSASQLRYAESYLKDIALQRGMGMGPVGTVEAPRGGYIGQGVYLPSQKTYTSMTDVDPYENPAMAPYLRGAGSHIIYQQAKLYGETMAKNFTANVVRARGGGRGGAVAAPNDFTSQAEYQKIANQATVVQLQNMTNGLMANGSLQAAAVQDVARQMSKLPPVLEKISAPEGTYLGQGVYAKPTVEKRPTDQAYDRFEKASKYYADMYNKSATAAYTYTTRQMTPDEINAMNPDQAYMPVMQIPQAATFDSIPNLHGYSTDTLDVAKSAKGFQMAFGDKGIAQRGLTDFFKERPQAYEKLNEIGNRAATFLSLKRGKLTPEDVVLYKKYLAQDKADRQAYLEAAKTARDEIAATNADTSLTAEEKKKRNQTSMGKLNRVGDPLTSGFTDVYGLKVGSVTDYASGAYNVPEEMKQYTDPIFGSVNDAIFEAVANSEEFQKLPKEEQDRIIKAAQQMPLQSMAMLSDALMDGVLDSDEVQNLWTYAGEDIATIRNMIAEGRGPTGEDKNLAYTPYIEGIATFTRREDVSGDLAQSMFMGWDNIVNVQFEGSGQKAWQAFAQGWDSSSGGAPLAIADVMSFDPAQIQRLQEEAKSGGKGMGTNMNEGVYEGLSADEALRKLLVDMFGENGTFMKVIAAALDKRSPSALYREEVGAMMMLGIVDGVNQEAPKLQQALKGILTATEKVDGKDVKYPVFRRLGVTAANQFVWGFTGAGAKETLAMRLQNALNKVVAVEQPSESTIALMENFQSFGGLMGDEFNKGFGYYVREYEQADTEGMTFHLGLAASFAAGVVGPQFSEVGKAAIEGIKTGIEDPTKYLELKGALETLAAKMVADAKTAINSSSPSKLFASEVGNPIVEGIAMGITDSSGVVADALSGATAGKASYRPSISSAALNGAANRAMAQNNSYSYNYNLGVTTNQSPSVVKRSFAVMKSFKGEI